MTCLQLAQEGRAISKRGFEASGLPAGRGGTDSTELVPAIVFVWPVSSQAGDKQLGISLAIIAVVNGIGSHLNTKFSPINTSLK
jgi:hypothetical protein